MPSTTITVDVSQVQQLALDLGDAAEVINTATAKAVNRAAISVRKHSVERVVSQVALAPAYVDQKTVITRDAAPSRLTATLEVADQPVFLYRYGAQQVSIANVWNEARYAAAFGGLDARVRPKAKAPYLPWTPRTGDALRGIPGGQKAGGVTVGVKRSNGRALLSHVYTLPLRGGEAAGRWGTFSRPKGGGKSKGMYGPSVYQVVKGVWSVETDTIVEMLGTSVLTDVAFDITKELRAA